MVRLGKKSRSGGNWHDLAIRLPAEMHRKADIASESMLGRSLTAAEPARGDSIVTQRSDPIQTCYLIVT